MSNQKLKEGLIMLPVLRSGLNKPSFIDDFLGRDFMENFFNERTGINVPAVNLVENNNEYRIEVAAPGLEKNDFKIDLDNDVLTISSEKEIKDEQKEEQFMRCEFNYSKFSRSFTLPDSANGDKVKATHKNGILYVHIPKREEAKQKPPRQIDIS